MTVYYLVASRASGLEGFRVVPTAVDVVVFIKVYEVDEYFFANATHETRRMPRRAGTHAARCHRHVPGLYDFLTLKNGLHKTL